VEAVRLEPLAARHADDLAAAAEEDRGSYGFTLVPRGSEVADYLEAQFARAAQGLRPVPAGPAGRRPRRGVHGVLGSPEARAATRRQAAQSDAESPLAKTGHNSHI
jgi:hypothetical protein